MLIEIIFFYIATALYLLATLASFKHDKPVLVLLSLALSFNTVSLATRWIRQGHGPYVDFWEAISSGVWGYHLALLIACLMIKRIRPMLCLILPVLSSMVIWNIFVTPRDTLLPVIFDTVWLPVHIIVGKVFIGCVLVALSISLVVLMRRFAPSLKFASMPENLALDELASRFILTGFVFQTLMLIVGAIWAQDAWGRYWNWDPLETWSFLTWLSVIFYLHLRFVQRSLPVVNACLILGTFILAFLTFFGVPFLSNAAHQGVV